MQFMHPGGFSDYAKLCILCICIIFPPGWYTEVDNAAVGVFFKGNTANTSICLKVETERKQKYEQWDETPNPAAQEQNSARAGLSRPRMARVYNFACPGGPKNPGWAEMGRADGLMARPTLPPQLPSNPLTELPCCPICYWPHFAQLRICNQRCNSHCAFV